MNRKWKLINTLWYIRRVEHYNSQPSPKSGIVQPIDLALMEGKK